MACDPSSTPYQTMSKLLAIQYHAQNLEDQLWSKKGRFLVGVSQHFCNWLLLALQPAHANQLAYCDCLLLVPCVIRTRNVSLWSHSRRLCSNYIGELLRRYENHTGLLFRHRRDFCHGSMERSYAAPFSKVERHIVDRLCAALKCSVNRYSNK